MTAPADRAGELLAGIRVIDVSHVIAGPTAGYYLARQGADVIKLEEPVHGDVLRHGSLVVDDGVSVGFAAINAGKRALALDLKDPAAVERVLQLAAEADVFIENFRPGVIARLGLDYERVRARNPDIVYASISGYGQEGSWSSRGAYDHVVQALTGMMALQGDEGTPPMKVGFPVVDAAAGMMGAQAILAALLARERGGGGAYLDVSMAQAALHLMLSTAVQAAFDGRDRLRPGNRGFSGSPGAATFRCADGWIATAANTAAQFRRFCELLDIADVLDDARLLDPEALRIGAGFVAPRDPVALQARIEAAVARHGAADLEARLNAADVPCARVRTVAEFVAEYAEGGLVTAPASRVEYPGGTVLDLGPGFKRDRRAPAAPARAPRHGERDLAWRAR
ncbi:MAG: CaiB/BaiF CoA transferase family protein [Lautropia sp.]